MLRVRVVVAPFGRTPNARAAPVWLAMCRIAPRTLPESAPTWAVMPTSCQPVRAGVTSTGVMALGIEAQAILIIALEASAVGNWTVKVPAETVLSPPKSRTATALFDLLLL